MQLRRATPDNLDAAGEVTVAAYADFTLGPDDPYVARLRDAGVHWVTGGGSELPLVARMLREEFGRRVRRSTYTRSATAIA